MEITDLGKSRLTGFQNTALTPLPINVNVTNAEILLGLAFKPAIPIGFQFLDQLNAEVTATVNLPRLDAKLSSNIAQNCAKGSNSTAPFSNKTAILSAELLALGPTALVEANVSLSMDLALDVAGTVWLLGSKKVMLGASVGATSPTFLVVPYPVTAAAV